MPTLVKMFVTFLNFGLETLKELGENTCDEQTGAETNLLCHRAN